MNIKYNVLKLKGNKTEEIKDFVSVEEPLEINLKYKIKMVKEVQVPITADKPAPLAPISGKPKFPYINV